MHALLAARSSFSIGESILTTERLVDEAKKVDAKVIGLTDTMSITGLIDLTNRAKKADIKPLIGCRLRVVDDPSWRKPKGEKVKAPPEYFLTWYVLSQKGLEALFKLLSLANSEERFYNTSKISFKDLYKALAGLTDQDVAISTGDMQGLLHHPDHIDILNRLIGLLGKSAVFACLVPVDAPVFDAANRLALRVIALLGIQPLTVRPVSYARDEADAAEVMGAISRNVKISDPWHNSPYVRDFHPRTAKELLEDCKGAINRLRTRFGAADPQTAFAQGLKMTGFLAGRVTFEWKKAPVSLPKMAPDEIRAVIEECKKGWTERFSSSVFGHKPTAEELKDVYRPRLAYELSVLKTLGFAGYFLLVQDVVRFAKTNGILVGPGRGSVGGSLVAYLMGITDCDPIRFELLFERFINPDRQDLPDADLDFMSERRHEVVEYLVGKYGRERVGGISNFATLASASAIRDVGRVFGLDENDYRCSKFVPKLHGVPLKLEKAAEEVPEIAEFRDRFKPIWDVCNTLEGVMRNLGQHAAGVVVAECPLVERAVVESRKGETVVNWDKRIVEDQGLIKMDILGLSTLDLIHLTLSYIRKRHSERVNLLRIPLDDEKVLANFATGKTTGIFQFESGGMRRLLKELGKDGTITFDDITAATALYRPGPMDSGMMDSYYKRKQGLEAVEYDHPNMREPLAPTFGVMVYQEQVMKVAQVVAGYSLPEADKLRKIMGKKLPEEMKKERGKFVDGAVKTVGMDEDEAGELFDKIEKFAGYGFNKSHSVEYTLISYQSMWLKTYYPVEFYAAALTLMKEEKLQALLKDARASGIEIVLPDINLSTDQFEILTDTKLCIPFGRIKGLSANAAKVIVEARGSKPFESMEDCVNRVNRRIVNKAKIELLDKIGAFASVEPGQPVQLHPDRQRDQRELIPGLVDAAITIDRDFPTDRDTKKAILDVVNDYYEEMGPGGGKDGQPVRPMFGKKARFMVIMDAPSREEEEQGQMSWGRGFSAISDALFENELSRADGYWTALIKRPKTGKQVSPDEIALYQKYLARELEILKSPVIVLMGSTTVRHFIPDFKGKASDSAGQIVYSPKYDANFVIGFSPGEIFHDPEKQHAMNDVFASVDSLIP